MTHYEVRERYRGAALLEVRLETGRQHQIRLHLQSLGHPLVGEKVYVDDESRVAAARQMLHAWRLAFPHPISGHEVAAEAPMPDDFLELCRKLRRTRVS